LNEPQAVVAALENAPAVLLPLVWDIPEPVRKRRPEAGLWSAHEHAVHLALLHPVFRERLERMLVEDNPSLEVWTLSPEQEAALLDTDLNAALECFVRERAELVERLRGLTEEQWLRPAEHPEIEGCNVFRLFRRLALYDLHHGFRIEELRARKSWPEEGTEPLPISPLPETPTPAEALVPGSLARMRAGEINSLGLFEVPGLAARCVRIYLPRDYTPERSWPAIWLFDGQNVFDDAPSFSGGWYVHEGVESLARGRRPTPVAIGIEHGGPGRNLELSPFPFGEEQGLAPVLLDWITNSLMPALTAELNLVPGPVGSVVGGSSMGGLCSLWSHFHYPHAFGGALVMSPSFWVADQAIFMDLVEQPTPPVSRIYLDAGAREDKGRLLPVVAAMAAHLAGRGYDDDSLMWRPDARGGHNESSWRRRMPKALRFFYR
jgi:predicted alpha/beta superfamily hydrolase